MIANLRLSVALTAIMLLLFYSAGAGVLKGKIKDNKGEEKKPFTEVFDRYSFAGIKDLIVFCLVKSR